MLAAQAGVSLETAILYDEIQQALRGLREGERRGDRVARPDDERSLAPRGRPHRGAREGRRRRDDAARTRTRRFTPRGPARARVREPAARLRQDRRPREGPRQGEEALRRAARARARALRLRRAVDRGRRARRARCARSSGRRAARQLEALDGELAAAAGGPRRRVGRRRAAPTSRPCSRAATSRASRRSRARRTSTCAATCRPLLDDEEVTCLKVSRGSLTHAGVRRDPLARVAHVPVPLAHPVGQVAAAACPLIAGAHHERLNGTGYPNRLARRGDPGAVEDDERSPTSTTRSRRATARTRRRSPSSARIDILDYSVKDGHLDAELVRIFKEARVWEPGRAS